MIDGHNTDQPQRPIDSGACIVGSSLTLMDLNRNKPFEREKAYRVSGDTIRDTLDAVATLEAEKFLFASRNLLLSNALRQVQVVLGRIFSDTCTVGSEYGIPHVAQWAQEET